MISLAAALALLAAGLEVAALISRLVETYRAPSVSGLSAPFLWMSVALNVAWAAYGGFIGAPALLYPSVFAVGVFGYALWRVHTSGRPQWKPLPLIIVVTAALVTVAYFSPDAVGYIGGVMAVGTCIPQAWRVWRTRDADGIAPVAWLITIGFCSVWAAYGFADNLPPVWSTNVLVALLATVVLVGYLRARRGADPA